MSETLQRERENTTLGWGRRAESGFGKPASRNPLVDQGIPSLPLAETSCHGVNPRTSGPWPGTSNNSINEHLSESALKRLRPAASTGQLRNAYSRYGEAGKPTRALIQQIDHVATDDLSIATPQPASPILFSPSVSTVVSLTEKRQDALGIFEQYGISRPLGWLSDDEAACGQLPSTVQVKSFQICHSCGEPLSSQQYCARCGHSSCLKCIGEVRDEDVEQCHTDSYIQANEHHAVEDAPKEPIYEVEPVTREMEYDHTTAVTVHTTNQPQATKSRPGEELLKQVHCAEWTSRQRFKPSPCSSGHQPRKIVAVPTVVSVPVKSNPFFVADREAKSQVSRPQSTVKNIEAKRYPKPSDCLPPPRLQRSSSPPADEVKCSDPSCRATHAGHHPVRHSISCIDRRLIDGMETVDTNNDEVAQPRKESPLQSTLAKKINQLYQHAEDLHHSQHIIEHLAAGTKTRERIAAARQKWVEQQNARFEMNDTSLGLHAHSSREHSLSHDEMSAADQNTVRHSLSTDPQVFGVPDEEEHSIEADPEVDREASPKTHGLSTDDCTQIGQAVESHTLCADRDFETQQGSRSPNPDPAVASSDDINNVLRSKPGSPEETGIGIIILDSPQSLHRVSDSPGPIVETSQPQPVVELSTMKLKQRREASHTDHLDDACREANNISTLKKQLKNVDVSEAYAQHKQLTPPIVKWRRSLNKTSRTPQSDMITKDSCNFCYPSELPSPELQQTPQSIVQDRTNNAVTHAREITESTPRLRLMDIEQLLARESVQSFMQETQSKVEEETITKTEHSRNASRSSLENTSTVVEIHNPMPQLPYNHVCAWRTRYMDLSTEFEQIKSEASPRATHNGRTEVVDTTQSNVDIGASIPHKCADVEIEGLTIVMHMRGKEDLVINTSLKEDEKS